ncbi:MAG: PAS domain S-box protein [Bacteroidales bacterium]
MPNVHILWDREKGEVIAENRSIFNELGYEKDNDTPKDWREIVHPDDQNKVEYNIKTPPKSRINSEITSNEIRLMQSDGSWVWYQYSQNNAVLPDADAPNLLLVSLTPLKGALGLEQSLKESNQRFKALAEASMGGIGIHDKGKIIEANHELSIITGYSYDELIGMDGLLLIHPDERERVMQKIVSGYGESYESIGLRKDGTSYPLEIRGKQLPFKGKLVRVTEFRDITQQKKFQRALKNSEEKYREIIEFAVDGFLIGDENGYVIEANERICQIFGRDRQNVVGKHIKEFFAAKVLEKKPLRFDLLNTGQTFTNEREIIRPDGSIVIIEMHSKKMPNGNYQAIIRDITERKKTHAKFKAIFDNANDAIFLMDPNKIRDCNKITIKLFGYQKEEIIGASPAQLSPKYQPDGLLSDGKSRDYLQRAAKGEAMFFEWVHQKADGTLFNSEISLNRLQIDGEVIIQAVVKDITERKHYEESLRISEQRLRMVIDATNDAIWDWDLTTNKAFFSDRYYTMLGYEPGEFEASYESWRELLHPNDLKFTEIVVKKYLEEKETDYNLEFRMRTKEGEWRWIQARGKIVERDRDNKPLRLVGTHTDITDRKLVEEELKESYNFVQSVLDTIPVRVFWKDNNLKYLGCNKVFANDAGFKNPQDVVGLTDLDLPWSKEADQYRSDDLAIMKSKFPKLNFEEPQTALNGDKLWLRTSKIPLRDSNGKVIGILGTYDDITQSKKYNEIIELERAYFEQLFESAPEGIVLLDVDDKVIRCNEEFVRMFGYTQQEMKGKPINSFIVSDELKEEGLHLTNTVAAGDVVMHETLRKRKDGTQVHVSILGKPIYFKGGKLAVYGIYRDITDRKVVEEELISKNHEIEAQNEEYRIINEELYVAKQKAEESDKLKSAFLANMSHEIRTPMNGILGFSQLLTDPNIPEVEVKQYVEVIQSCGNQLLGIINDLIDISKVESNQITISKRDTDVNKIINEQLLLFKQKAEEKGVDISCQTGLPDYKAEIVTDEGRLKQVVSNLLANALKFTNEGYIKFGYELKGDYLEFYVKDTGVGISPKHHEIIFQRFRQVETKISTQVGGTGLGLAISKAYIEKMGGEIWVDSDTGKGTTFFFTIPYKPGMSVIEHEDKEVLEHINKIKPDVNVLVAEDDDVNFFFIKEMLADYPINIVRAIDGQEAVDIVADGTDIDLVLMDIKMPRLDGYEATKQIKQIRWNLPVIVQTAYAFSSDENKANEAGCDDYISKPIDRLRFIELMAKHLESD